jgi:hypothetical protein
LAASICQHQEEYINGVNPPQHQNHTAQNTARSDKTRRILRILTILTAFLTALTPLILALTELVGLGHSLGWW